MLHILGTDVGDTITPAPNADNALKPWGKLDNLDPKHLSPNKLLASSESGVVSRLTPTTSVGHAGASPPPLINSPLAVTDSGQVYAWGDNDHGQQGNTTTTVNRKYFDQTLSKGVVPSE